MKFIKDNIYIKILVIVVITLLLLIPTAMIQELVEERESRQEEAIKDVSSKWAEEQTLVGPFISIPYYKYITHFDKKDSTEKIVKMKEHIHVLPTQLTITGDLTPEKRYRGLYEVVVYNSKLKLSGNFRDTDISTLEIDPKDIQYDKARLILGINDLRGIEHQVTLNWGGEKIYFNPGVLSKKIVKSGINAAIDLNGGEGFTNEFELELDLNGSQFLHFTPVGKITDITINSNWQTPSFNGAFLPDSREVDENGFVANWNVLHLNRNYPQMFIGNSYSLNHSTFGIDMLLPVDNYQKTYRSIRYAILFIGFTFLVFFFIEILNKILLHPIHYILVGMALIVFFILLLSISEQLNFNSAFLLSAVATLFLVSGYLKAILKSNKLSLMVTGVLLLLYLFIFVIIQLQDLALLIGSIGVFLILSTVMYLSREIDWYAINNQVKGAKKAKKPSDIKFK